MKGRKLFDDRGKKNSQLTYTNYTSKRSFIQTSQKSTMSQQQFSYQFSQFTMDLSIYQEVKQNIKYLYELYSGVSRYGGLLNVLANNQLKAIIQEMSIKFPEINALTAQNVFQHYLKFYIFCFEVVIQTGRKVENQKLMYLSMARFITGSQLADCLTDLEKGLKLYDEDITVLVQLCYHLGLKDSIFNLDYLRQTCGHQTIKIVIQQIDESDLADQNNQNCSFGNKLLQSNLGFSKYKKLVAGQLSKQKIIKPQDKAQIIFNQYYQYYCNHQGQSFDKVVSSKLKANPKLIDVFDSNEHKKVIFGAQFDPKTQKYIKQIFNKVNSTFLGCRQKFDLLNYADEDIPGITIPNFCLQLNGCWSGGRQQPFGFSKVDINFGPDSTQWYCISIDHLNKFQYIFKQQYSFSLQKVEGLWFQNIDWFIQRKIPIKKIIQKKGDAVILGNGSLSWFKSKGKSLHIYWNICPKSQKQITATVNRCTKMKESWGVSKSQIEKQVKIPLKSIFLRLLNHEQSGRKHQISASSTIMIRQTLKKWYTDEQKSFNQMIVKQQLVKIKYKHYNLFDAQSFCVVCQAEVLNYFVNNNGLCCLQCVSKLIYNKEIYDLKDKTLYYKYDPYWVYKLIYCGNSRQMLKLCRNYPQFQELCLNQFLGVKQVCLKFTKKIANQLKSCQNQEWELEINQLNESNIKNNIQKLIQEKIKRKKEQPVNKYQNSKVFSVQTNLSIPKGIKDEQIEYVAKQKTVQLLKYNTQNFQDQSRHELQLSVQSKRRKQLRKKLKQSQQNSSGTQCTSQFESFQQWDDYKKRDRYRVQNKQKLYFSEKQKFNNARKSQKFYKMNHLRKKKHKFSGQSRGQVYNKNEQNRLFKGFMVERAYQQQYTRPYKQCDEC